MRDVVEQIEIHDQHGEVAALKLLNGVTPPFS